MSRKQNSWFEVDKEGLSKLQKRYKNRAFIIYELVQNAWDEASKNVDIQFKYIQQSSSVLLTVTDDNPEGFKNLEHAYTLFAKSEKKHDPNKRGRFNVGEKFVLASCSYASIRTTKGTIVFNEDGSREHKTDKILKGSQFVASIQMEENEFNEICLEVEKLIPPKHIKTKFCGKTISRREPIASFRTTLLTEVTDKEDNLRPSYRKCQVNIYRPFDKPTIYEMGIPVVEIDDKFDIDIQQKVPLSMDRCNIRPSYLRELRVCILNETYDILETNDCSEPWVQEASSDKNCSVSAIKKVVGLKFGEKRTSFDLSDLEANRIATSKGYTVVAGGSLSKGQWSNIRKAGTILPSGQVTPSPKPFSPNGEPLKYIPREKWSPKMREVADFITRIGKIVLEISVLPIQITNDRSWNFSATYGKGSTLILNKAMVGNKFFEEFPENVNRVCNLLIHELAHHYSTNHLSEEYYNALSKIGGKMIKLALDEPNLFYKKGI